MLLFVSFLVVLLSCGLIFCVLRLLQGKVQQPELLELLFQLRAKWCCLELQQRWNRIFLEQDTGWTFCAVPCACFNILMTKRLESCWQCFSPTKPCIGPLLVKVEKIS